MEAGYKSPVFLLHVPRLVSLPTTHALTLALPLSVCDLRFHTLSPSIPLLTFPFAYPQHFNRFPAMAIFLLAISMVLVLIAFLIFPSLSRPILSEERLRRSTDSLSKWEVESWWW